MASVKELLCALAVKDEIIDAQRKTIEQLQNLLSTRQSTTRINLAPEVPSRLLSIEQLQERLDRMTKPARKNNVRKGSAALQKALDRSEEENARLRDQLQEARTIDITPIEEELSIEELEAMIERMWK